MLEDDYRHGHDNNSIGVLSALSTALPSGSVALCTDAGGSALLGQPVSWQVQVRRFWCQNAQCPRKLFCERLPTCAPPYARRTLRQVKTVCAVTLAVGVKVGERVLAQLAIPTSHDTLLRHTRRSTPKAVKTPRVLGVDDFGATRSCMCSCKDSRKEDLTWVLPLSAITQLMRHESQSQIRFSWDSGCSDRRNPEMRRAKLAWFQRVRNA